MRKVTIGAIMLILCFIAMIFAAPHIDIPLNIWAYLSLVLGLISIGSAYLVIANIDEALGDKG